MLRTTLVRSQLLKETTKKLIRNSATRAITAECSKRKYHNRKVTPLLKPQPLRWNETVRYYADLPAHAKVTLPALSPTMETGNIVSWAKKEGDKLNEGDLLAEIETDKATMGFETPEEGYLAKILIPAGSKGVPIGKLVCIIVQNQADVAAFKDFKDESAPAAAAKPAAKPAPAAQPTPVARPAAPAPTPTPPPAGAPPGSRVYASPMAKRLAEQRNIRLQGKGTGLYGSITSGDLGKMGAPAPGAPPPRAGSPGPAPVTPSYPQGVSYIDIPVTGVRAIIAQRLQASKQTLPHYYVSVDIVMDKIMEFREKYNEKLEKKKIRLSVNDFIIKAAAMALVKVPTVNSSWMDNVIRQYKHADISVAVASDKGLITPIIFEADRKGVIQISQEIRELAGRARQGKLAPHEFQGGTFSVSNLGMFGVSHFTSIINYPPQSAILAVGAARTQLVEDTECKSGIRKQQVMTVTLSSDHRVIDGAIAATWLSAFREHLEEPASMIV